MPQASEAPVRIKRLARLRARFDAALLTEPQAGPAETWQPALTSDLQAALTTLCAGPAGFVVTQHMLAAQPTQRDHQKAWLNHRLLALDGTMHMQSLGGPWRQRLHRLALKAREFSAGAAGPWDCGFLNTGARAAAAASAFVPRRPTLMVAWQLPAAARTPLMATLQARSGVFAWPVRLWVLDAPTPR